MHTCRFCKSYKDSRSMVKYAARHWAHFECWLATKGLELSEPGKHEGLLQMLHTSFHGWQLRQFPVFAMAEWLEKHETAFPAEAGKTWVDKACWIIKRSIAISDAPAERIG